jgi:hypothetical protein
MSFCILGRGGGIQWGANRPQIQVIGFIVGRQCGNCLDIMMCGFEGSVHSGMVSELDYVFGGREIVQLNPVPSKYDIRRLIPYC